MVVDRSQLAGGCILYAPEFGKAGVIAPRPAPDRDVMPFGKCRGWCLHEVVTGDAQYASWLMDQPWFEQKYPAIYQYFAERLYQGPSAA